MASKSFSLVFRCAHLNLNHTRRVNIQLAQDITRFSYDLVNDPYVFENRISEFPLHFRKFHHNCKPLAGIIVSNSDYKVFPLLIDRNIVAVEIVFGNELLVLISIYCLPNANIENDLAVLQSLILNNGQKKILIFGDFNATSPLWGKRGMGDRGRKVADLVFNNDLFIVNNSDSPPSYWTSGKKLDRFGIS
ncbi:hypothetical protein AVEN_226818-1 [Araneus ventricosus]|uniref:Endonuclease/exonuclease/phosphatase domain-containing protein n=1 Tax=Araneus ventricosus TaxID=182803 RepID=A0A4Y2V2V3_ARAVE|nr:hypothetical protein AVEN_226818-1 [Araneus ventricosus]